MRSLTRRAQLIPLALGLAVAMVPFASSADTPAGASAPAPTPESFVLYRQKVMGAIFGNCGAIGDILKNGLPYQANIPTHAKLLHGNIGMIETAFKQKVSEGKTDAKATIWEDWSKFDGKVKALDAEVAKLESVAAKGNAAEIGAQFGKVGAACKSCHDDFRKPKEESWKGK